MSDAAVAVVIPTRNRPDLALGALRSTLGELPKGGRVFVSDNSSPETRERLSAECRDLDDPRLTYIAPPEELPMSPHWQWALDRALAETDVTHVAFLTDRMFFRDGELAHVSAIASENDADVISYNLDHIDDSVDPVILIQYAWTGRTWRLDSELVLREAARGRFPPFIPRMLNCVVPKGVFGRISERFGSVFGSVSPDFCFAYRCLDVVDATLHYDKSVLMDSGYDRSIGANYLRGLPGEHMEDFVDSVGHGAATRATPLPEVPVYPNPMFREYLVAMEQSPSDKFTPLDKGRYLASLSKGATAMEDAEVRRRTEAVLADAGWSGCRRLWHSALTAGEALRYLAHPRDFIRRILWRRRRRLGEPGRAMRGLLRRLRMLPAAEPGGSPAQAVTYATRHPVERVRRPVALRSLLAGPTRGRSKRRRNRTGTGGS